MDCERKCFSSSSICFLFCIGYSLSFGQVTGNNTNILSALDDYNVSWNVPGPTSSQSMPLGNGDIGLNVWMETNGDVSFYISKSDAWDYDIWDTQALMKLGQVRVSISPSPFTGSAPVLQTLKLHEGEIEIKEGYDTNQVTFDIWVDANRPVIRVAAASNAKPVSMTVGLIDWRFGGSDSDTLMANQTNRIAWCHRNTDQTDPHVAGLCFGAAIKGDGLIKNGPTNLQSSTAASTQLFSIYPLTAYASTNQWLAQLEGLIGQTDTANLEQSRLDHRAWWDGFWNRSWIFVTGDNDATNLTRGYVLQRFVTACAGRGAYPIKFNGSLFVVDDPAHQQNADYRVWGGQYWFQNTRAMYWPRLAAGDFDLMLPMFKMYSQILSNNASQVTAYYHHQGAYFAEAFPSWGGLNYYGPEVPGIYTGHYFSPVLELSMMMLDYYEFTGDTNFLSHYLLPAATAGLTFYDQHFARDAQGKLLLDPVNALETYWKVHDPAPDIAGLQAVLPRMISLTNDTISASNHAVWVRMLGQIPDLPVGRRAGKCTLLPYSGPQTNIVQNVENPELYAIYPFRLYGLGKPDVDLAISTFNERYFTKPGCWVQDPIQAAMLGLTNVAKQYTLFNLTNTEPSLKFPAFWAKGNDYTPDEDNGGNAEHALQQMIMQTDGRKILLCPAWPSEWNVTFKLNAPFQTVVQGAIQNGKLTNLVVSPPERMADVVDLSHLIAPDLSLACVLSPHDFIVPLKWTTRGSSNTLALASDSDGAGVTNAIDQNLGTKYFNKAQDVDGSLPGVNTGFVVTPAKGLTIVTAMQFAAGSDMPSRDPSRITIEGSNASDAAKPGASGFTLIYEGTTGLATDQDRNSWGRVIEFANTAAYSSYRVLVTEVAGGTPDATQYSEVRLGTAVDLSQVTHITRATMSRPVFILQGQNGRPGSSYSVLASTNAAWPSALWTVEAMGVFGSSNGTFSNTISIAPDEPVRVYRISQP